MPEAHVLHDFTRGPFAPETDFDLVWCCEFVEHVEERYLPHFLATFARGTRFVMMTHARPGQPGHHHVNCREAGYWVEHLASVGFRFDAARTEHTRSLAGRGHFASNGLFFHR